MATTKKEVIKRLTKELVGKKVTKVGRYDYSEEYYVVLENGAILSIGKTYIPPSIITNYKK